METIFKSDFFVIAVISTYDNYSCDTLDSFWYILYTTLAYHTGTGLLKFTDQAFFIPKYHYL